MNPERLFQTLTFTQGLYYLVTGIWPLVSPGTFQKVTGPKTDIWLVKTVGVLVAVIGAVLTQAGARRQSTREIPMLAMGSAAGLAAIDVIYARSGRISKIYLLDAVAQAALIVGWAFVRRRGTGIPLIAELFRREDATERDETRRQLKAAGHRAATETQPHASGEALGL